jgi:hypothetical protein
MMMHQVPRTLAGIASAAIPLTVAALFFQQPATKPADAAIDVNASVPVALRGQRALFTPSAATDWLKLGTGDVRIDGCIKCWIYYEGQFGQVYWYGAQSGGNCYEGILSARPVANSQLFTEPAGGPALEPLLPVLTNSSGGPARRSALPIHPVGLHGSALAPADTVCAFCEGDYWEVNTGGHWLGQGNCDGGQFLSPEVNPCEQFRCLDDADAAEVALRSALREESGDALVEVLTRWNALISYDVTKHAIEYVRCASLSRGTIPLHERYRDILSVRASAANG